MKNKVIIKGNKHGITIVLDPDIEFDKLLEEMKVRLKSTDNFFDSDKQIAASFEGRELSNDELDMILAIIQENSKLNIQYIIDDNSNKEQLFLDRINSNNTYNTSVSNSAVNNNALETSDDTVIYNNEELTDIISDDKDNIISTQSIGMFYKGTLRSGQKLESDDSIIIIGDVNPGASVIAGGNIVIIGSLTGSVQAGANGNRNSFVMALSMEPIQIQIADIIARSSDKKSYDRKLKISDKRDKKDKKQSRQDAMLATIIDNHIYMESISKNSLSEIII